MGSSEKQRNIKIGIGAIFLSAALWVAHNKNTPELGAKSNRNQTEATTTSSQLSARRPRTNHNTATRKQDQLFSIGTATTPEDLKDAFKNARTHPDHLMRIIVQCTTKSGELVDVIIEDQKSFTDDYHVCAFNYMSGEGVTGITMQDWSNKINSGLALMLENMPENLAELMLYDKDEGAIQLGLSITDLITLEKVSQLTNPADIKSLVQTLSNSDGSSVHPILYANDNVNPFENMAAIIKDSNTGDLVILTEQGPQTMTEFASLGSNNMSQANARYIADSSSPLQRQSLIHDIPVPEKILNNPDTHLLTEAAAVALLDVFDSPEDESQPQGYDFIEQTRIIESKYQLIWQKIQQSTNYNDSDNTVSGFINEITENPRIGGTVVDAINTIINDPDGIENHLNLLAEDMRHQRSHISLEDLEFSEQEQYSPSAPKINDPK